MRKRLKLFGERNTGTRYLAELIALNLEIDQMRGAVPSILGLYPPRYPGGERLRDFYFWLAERQTFGWKHSCAALPIAAEGQTWPLGPVCLATLSKNPYSWLLSLHRNPYHQYGINGFTFEAFLTTRWTAVRRDRLGAREVSSPIELWNIKNRSYLDLRRLQAFCITTEHLLDDPSRIVDELESRFSIARRGRFRNVERSTKGTQSTFADYRGYYGAERWRSLLSPRAIAIINSAIDTTLMRELGYSLLQPSDGVASPGGQGE